MRLLRAAMLGSTVMLFMPGSAGAQWGGPDAFGYRWSDTQTPLDGQQPVYAWNPRGGKSLFLGDDVFSPAIALPFTFQFYGTNYSQVYVSSNGFVSFTGDYNGCCSGVVPPNAGIPNGWAACMWNDIYPPCSGTIQ